PRVWRPLFWRTDDARRIGRLLFPAVPARGLNVAGWVHDGEWVFIWPLWIIPSDLHVVRSMLQMRELITEPLNERGLIAIGVRAVFQARRTRVPPRSSKYKLNFGPARALFSATSV